MKNLKFKCVFFLIFASPVLAQEAKLSSLLERSPATTNSIGYIHTESLAKLVGGSAAEGMAQKVDDIWFASEIDIVELHPRWEAGFATLRKAYRKDAVVKATEGYVDKVEGREAIWTSSQSYLVPLSDNVLGFLRPANRSMLANFFKDYERTSTPSYLIEKSAQSEKYLSFMVAVSMENAFSPMALQRKLAGLDSVKGMNAAQQAKAAEVLASIRGASLILGRKDLAQCIIELTFGESPAVLGPVANKLFHEITVKNGSEVAELSNWKSKVEDKKLVFRGELSKEALHSLLGIFTLADRAEKLASSVSSDRESPSASTEVAYKTRDYFKGVRDQIEQVRSHNAKTPGAMAKWNNNRARRIDDMSIIGVDDEMVDYGAFVAASLRNDSLAIQKINIKAGQIQQEESLNDGYYYYNRDGYYNSGYGYYNNSRDQQRVTGAKARGSAYASYRQMLSAVDQRTADTKRAMERKFQIEF